MGGEKGRWGQLAKELKVFYEKLTGDVLVSAGLMGYLGAFTAKFRENICNEWIEKCRENDIPSSDTFSLVSVLGDPVLIREWNINGLPSDNFSVDNGIIVKESRRWPLLIDPQIQANKWIKKMEESNNVSVITMSDPNLLRALENCIRLGKPLLIEDLGEVIEAEALPSSQLVGKSLREAKVPKGVAIGGILRDDKVIPARGDTVIEAGDTVAIFAARGRITQVEKLLSVRLDFF